MIVNNMPGWAREKAFVVVRMVNGEAWYYGAWDDLNGAIRQASEVRGMVLAANEIAERKERS